MAKLITGVIGPGSMLPITVGDFEKALSRSRAEVLAAAITLFAKREPHHRAWDEPVRLLRNLQPAAKALEELLREERERPICDCHNWDSAEELHRYLVAVEKQRVILLSKFNNRISPSVPLVG